MIELIRKVRDSIHFRLTVDELTDLYEVLEQTKSSIATVRAQIDMSVFLRSKTTKHVIADIVFFRADNTIAQWRENRVVWALADDDLIYFTSVIKMAMKDSASYDPEIMIVDIPGFAVTQRLYIEINEL